MNKKTRRQLSVGSYFTVLTLLTLVSGCQTNTVASDILEQESIEQANLESAVRCMEILEVDLNVELFGEKCVADGHIEHSPHVPDTKQGLLNYFASQLAKFPDMHGEIKRAGADGDLVWMHIHFKAQPDSPGNAAIHIFRMKNKKFVEHWAAGQPVSESSLHDNSMF